MQLEIKRATRRPEIVKVVRITQENVFAIKEWVGSKCYIVQPTGAWLRVEAPNGVFYQDGRAGDWVIDNGEKFAIVQAHKFDELYQLVEDK